MNANDGFFFTFLGEEDVKNEDIEADDDVEEVEGNGSYQLNKH